MEKISALDKAVPQQLQWKVWMTLHIQFAQRGNENDDSMKKDDLMITKENSHKVLRLRDYLTKNHRGSDLTKFSEGVIVETGGEDCPILLIESYLSHLNPHCPFLWQRPLCSYRYEDDIWFTRSKCGHNTMVSMMKNISKFLNMSRIYTNHSVRATSITLLGQSFQDNDIRAVSGHKTLVALGVYKRTSGDTLATMSRALQAHLTPKRICSDSRTPTSERPCSSTSAVTPLDIPCSSSRSSDSVVAPLDIPCSSSRSSANVVSHLQNCSSITVPPVDIPFCTSSTAADSFQKITKICAQNDSRVFSQFAPHMQNCDNVTFNFNFHK